MSFNSFSNFERPELPDATPPEGMPGEMPNEFGSFKKPSSQGGGTVGKVLGGLLLLILIGLIVMVLIPSLRERFVSPAVNNITSRVPFLGQEQESSMYMASQPGGELSMVAPTLPPPTATPTPTPHPAQNLDMQIGESGENGPRWQIAYPDAERGPGLGCAYFSFWLVGNDNRSFTLLDTLNARLDIYDGEFLLESYGPAPLSTLRGLGDPSYYELPAGAPACTNHRFMESGDYVGFEFRLTLLGDGAPIRQMRAVPVGQAMTFATVTPTPTPAPPTATPFPQVRINQSINVRNGPGTAYRVLGAARVGDVYPVQAASPARDWYRIDYLGQAGWVLGEIVETAGVDGVASIASLPPTPPPTETPTPVPPTPTVTPVPTPYIPFLLTSSGTCEPNAAMTYFAGAVVYESGDPFNGACVHVAYEGPRNTKCTGCDGAEAGTWGFAPFGNLPGKPGTTVRIYIAPCPEDGVPAGGQNPATGFGPLAPASPVWTYTVGESVQCTGITFQANPPPAPEE